ncbi:hypothetical protein AC790_21775 [Pantoea sp. RIT-PI-b]|uniref:NAD-dependent epimerase/dehydratase family protein n=1 Tax=Pantoea sp. RIT-PI-b TaxID=1681195 RepID=UPI0006768DEC|nr:NAD-dependent epimerase/dehydratase family protein [Pantoea sp. RIT-PI-b]KNC05659.1 hypothetical protein AC790_21775 [Pantoea sp. RIT-PI-b]
MNSQPLVGILGARGAVGEQVIALLADVVPLRAGSRGFPVRKHPGVDYREVDLFDEDALHDFCHGCQLIINCAAPGCQIGDRVARMAAESDCDYVDPGGDDNLYSLLKGKVNPERHFILSAGMLPGLSGLLLRSAIRAFDHLQEAKGYALSCEPFSFGGAADFLASLDNGYGVAGAALRQGELQLCPGGEPIQLPLAQTSAAAFPFMTNEWQRIGASQPALDLTWYNLFSSEALTQWLTQRSQREEQAAEALVALSIQAFAGKRLQHVMAVEAYGEKQGHLQRRACVVECASGAQLTAAVTAFATLKVIQRAVPTGLHFAADVLPPAETLQYLQRQIANFCWLELPSLLENVEGAI